MWLGPRRPRRSRPRQIEGDPETVAAARRALEDGASSLLDELRLSLDFYGAQEGAVPVERIVLCGPGSAIPGLAAAYGAEPRPADLGSAAHPRSPVSTPASAARLTLSYGLALES